jgi:shikimate kinase
MASGKQINLYLIGFMGTGKSVLGRRLAQRLKLAFYDSDQAIEQAAAMPVPRIFEELGEEHFRRMERAFIAGGHPDTGCLVSCGGGLAVQPGMMPLLKERGVVLALFASVKTILERTGRHANRPLLQVEDPASKVATMLAEREPVYQQAHACLSTDARSMSETLDNLARAYRSELRARQRQGR